ncbi:MAG TPA: tetratricopeptide repeat protein [Candidatus Angelobacter sp.]|nr:tetratricopeptide repeat protein [Candidatus Angelobacter sp.]
MKTPLLQRIFSALMIFVFLVPQSWATCGGGGGGGMGGMGAGASSQTYQVPWKLIKPEEPPIKEGLAFYWFPTGADEVQKSSLRESRTLQLYSQQCVTMGIVDARSPIGQKYVPDGKLPVAVLVQPDGTVVNKVENKNGKLSVGDLEKILESEMKKRESALKEKMEDAKSKAKGGDHDTAVAELRQVAEQKCMFPGKAKDAVKELKKLGVTDMNAELMPDSPNFDPALSAKIQKTMSEGLKAENDSNYMEAKRLYIAAAKLDPNDPTPLRYLGELYRHHIGDWDKARTTFNQILAIPADPLSRAVALHGLGKMTIHEGDFKKGLSLMESSTREYPLALAYRNLAVYWNSEGDKAKADHYTREALALDPHEPFNLIFAAAFMAGNGHGDEALKIAKENEAILCASYNLAAIYAQIGQKDKALSLLKRHFFEYERYQSVRSKEMMEARVDAVFASLYKDPAFIALTSGADGRLPLPNMGGGAKPAGN